MNVKKRHELTLCLISKSRDCCGIWEVSVLINNKPYTYPLVSEFAVRKIESLLHRHLPWKALKLLNMFKVKGFNSFEKGEQNG